MPGVALGVVVHAVDGVERIERRAPLVGRAAAAHELRLWVEQLPVSLAALSVELRCLLVAHAFGHSCHGIGGNAILKGLGHRLVGRIKVGGNVAILVEQLQAASRCLHRGLQGLKGMPLVAYQSLHHQVGQGDYTRIAHHAVGLIAHEMPHRQTALLVSDAEESAAHVGGTRRLDDRQQRHLRTISVPKRESGVVVARRVTMHLTVGTAIGAVNIVEDGGRVERMIDGRVINLPYLVAC